MQVGSRVSDFALPDHNGVPWRLSTALEHGPVVIFFYPKSLSPTCTAQACHFRDLEFEFIELGASIVGISTDPLGRQRAFSHYLGSAFPILSDETGAVARVFGVARSVFRVRRRTFVITPDSVVAGIVRGEFVAEKHADDALEMLRTLARTT